MNKIFLIFSALVLFVGCSSETTDNSSDETTNIEENVLTEREYYDIVIESIDSSKQGSVNGEFSAGVLQGGASITTYSGTLSSGNVSLIGTTESIGENEFTLESNLKSPSVELSNISYGMTSLYDIDTSTCSLQDRVVTCIVEEIDEADTINGSRHQYIFSFDESNELSSININYAMVDSMYQPNGGENLLEEISNFFDNPHFQFFINMEVYGNIAYGSETIEY
ncbi:MAG: hypothetical protein ACK5K7_06200 [Bacilli bacterium]